MFKNQNTISKSIEFSGIGLHSGEKVNIILKPAPIDSGVRFLINKNFIQALWKNAIVSQLCTKIKIKKNSISTIEHLMAAISGLGITNIIIKINSVEVPILDGSSKEFVEQIKYSGILDQKKTQKILKIKKKVEYKNGDKYICISPSKSKNLKIDYTINYQDQLIKHYHFCGIAYLG